MVADQKTEISTERDQFENTALLYKAQSDELNDKVSKLEPLVSVDLELLQNKLKSAEIEHQTKSENLHCEIEELQIKLSQQHIAIEKKEDEHQDTIKKLKKQLADSNKDLNDAEDKYHDLVDKHNIIIKERDDIMDESKYKIAELDERYTHSVILLKEECSRYKEALEAAPTANLQETLRLTTIQLSNTQEELGEEQKRIQTLTADNTLLQMEKVGILKKMEDMGHDALHMNKLLSTESTYDSRPTSATQRTSELNTVAELREELNRLELVHDDELEELQSHMTDENTNALRNLKAELAVTLEEEISHYSEKFETDSKQLKLSLQQEYNRKFVEELGKVRQELKAKHQEELKQLKRSLETVTGNADALTEGASNSQVNT